MIVQVGIAWFKNVLFQQVGKAIEMASFLLGLYLILKVVTYDF